MGTDFFLYFPDIRINIRTKPKIANTLIGSSRSLPKLRETQNTRKYSKYPGVIKYVSDRSENVTLSTFVYDETAATYDFS